MKPTRTLILHSLQADDCSQTRASALGVPCYIQCEAGMPTYRTQKRHCSPWGMNKSAEFRKLDMLCTGFN